jgi:hypothetical protein
MLGAKRRNNVAQPFANFLFVISFLCLLNPTKAELSSGLVEDQAIQLREKAISLGEQHQIEAATGSVLSQPAIVRGTGER